MATGIVNIWTAAAKPVAESFHRINAAYPIGERQIGPGYGSALLKETVGELVGQPIDHFVLINTHSDAWARTVEALQQLLHLT